MDGSPSTQVPLARPIPVILFYLTAAVTPGDGALHFAVDIYGKGIRPQDAQAAAAEAGKYKQNRELLRARAARRG